jgi:hypothetical protein
MRLHEWVFELEALRKQMGQVGGEVNASTPVVEEEQANVGAVVMGRNMFGGGPGPWRAAAGPRDRGARRDTPEVPRGSMSPATIDGLHREKEGGAGCASSR